MPIANMLIMAAHEMVSLNATVAGTVDGDTYDPNSLCNEDPHEPIRTPTGSVSFAVTGVLGSMNCTGLLVCLHSLTAGVVATFSGLGTVTAPTVPPGGIRVNGWSQIAATAASGFTFSLTDSGPVTIGFVAAGIWRQLRAMPTDTAFPRSMITIANGGEFGGIGYDKGAEARACGGTLVVDDAMKAILDAAFAASQNNSKPTALVPDDRVNDVWLVTWDSYAPRPLKDNVWRVDVVWREIARLRWPA